MLEKELDSYLDAARLAPDNSTYLNDAGKSFNTLAQYDKAIEYYEKALKRFKKAGLHHHAKTVEENIKVMKE